MSVGSNAMYAAINWAFSHAPNRLVYLQHRMRVGHRRNAWIEADYYVIHVPKTGGQSIAEAHGLLTPGHFVYSDLPAGFIATIRHRPHVAVIRSPIGRLRSTFRYAKMLRLGWPTTSLAGLAKYETFSDFAKSLPEQKVGTHYFLRPAVRFFDQAPLDRLSLIPFEHLQSGLDQLHDRLGLTRISLPHKNQTKDLVDLDLSLDEDAEAIVRAVYEEDFRLYEAIKDLPISAADEYLGPRKR